MIGLGMTGWLMFELASKRENMGAGVIIGLSLIPTVLAFVVASLRKRRNHQQDLVPITFSRGPPVL